MFLQVDLDGNSINRHNLNKMIKKTTVIIALLVSITGQSQKLTELYKEVKSSVVVINVINVSNQSVSGEIHAVSKASTGSGFLVSEDGLIWTAAHVVQSAEVVAVEFLDGDVYEAQVITANPQADVALIKIGSEFKLKQKHIAKIGDSDKAEIGEDVFVLGSPRGFKQSLSRGILSGRYQPENLSNDFIEIEFLQTDAAVNPGNSGGPMFNMKGEVIGIASRIYTNSGGFEGIGFAMSANVAKRLLTEETSLWGGLESILINGELATALNVPQAAGLLITSVSSKGTAKMLGLQGGYIPANINGTEVLIGGDVILDIGGIIIKDNNSLFAIRQHLNAAKKGESISISILRHGKIGKTNFSKQ